jgi:hypothetical protein
MHDAAFPFLASVLWAGRGVREYGGAATAVPDKERPKPPDEEERARIPDLPRVQHALLHIRDGQGKRDGGRLLICGNEDILLFNIGEEEPDE